MAIVKCQRGHYFDDEKYDACPMCQKVDSNEEEKTMAFFEHKSSSDDERTIGINFKKNKCNPVVGWLVCVEGPEKGRDFRIHGGRNFIGRAFNNDICLSEDSAISRNEEGYVIYEPNKSSFIVMNGESSSIRVNNEPILKPTFVTDGDRITIGKYELELVTYCKENKKW